MRNWRKRVVNWAAPLVCPGCEEGSGLILDCSTGRFERCSMCQSEPRKEAAVAGDADSQFFDAAAVRPLDRDDSKI
jgi:hypothetical protein